MELIFTIDDSENCYKEYQTTGAMPQKRIRTITVELTDEQIKRLKTLNHERITAVNIKL